MVPERRGGGREGGGGPERHGGGGGGGSLKGNENVSTFTSASMVRNERASAAHFPESLSS